LRTLASVYVLRPCDTCVLVYQRTKGQSDGGPTKVGVARRQRRQRGPSAKQHFWATDTTDHMACVQVCTACTDPSTLYNSVNS